MKIVGVLLFGVATGVGACGGGNAAARPDCPLGQTSLDGTCVSQQIADYVGCIRATGATVASNSARSLSAAAGVAGVTGSTQAEVKDKLEKSYATVSDANALEIIHNCYAKTAGAPVASTAAGGDACGKAGTFLVNSCGYQTDPGWYGRCQGSPEYQSCLAGAGSDCNSLSACGLADVARKWCGGAPVAAGSATCEATGACTHACKGDPACKCKCFTALRQSSAQAIGLVAQCYDMNCASACSEGSPSCDTCIQTHCGALYDRACKGN